MTLVAGIDTSTQSCKVVIRDAVSGKPVRFGKAGHPNGTQVDPEAWWQAFLQAREAAGGLADVSALGVGGQQHGMVLLDEYGRVIRDAMLWNDQSSAPQAEQLIVALGERATGQPPLVNPPQRSHGDEPAETSDPFHSAGVKAWADAVGTSLVASITITKLAWVAQNEPDNAARVAAVCLPHDWLSWRIAGYGPCETVEEGREALSHLFTDRSDASGTGYFDPSTNTYRTDLLDMAFGRHDVVLPTVLGPSDSAEKADPAIAGGAIDGGCLIGPGGGDNAMAAFGLSMTIGDVSISLGTSGVAAAVADHPIHDATGSINGFADCAGSFIPLACTINGSRILDAGCATLGVDYDELARLGLGAAPCAGGISLIPYFDGERTPNRPTATASLLGMTLANATRENMARAFLEALLCSQRDCVELLRALDVPIDRILLIGGGAKSPAVRALAPSIWGMDVAVPASDEYVAIGAARQAAWVLRRVHDTTGSAVEPPTWPITIDETYTGQPTEQVYQQYVRFRG